MRDLEIVRHRLANGLRVVLHPDHSLPLVAINLWYHVGSKNERPERTGLAHLFEHLLFQGSENVGTNDHFRRIQEVGGVANGSTWYDRTNYYETLPSNQLELGLWLESDRMGWFLPALTQSKLDIQLDVVLNERLQRTDNQPYGRAMEHLHELLFPTDHPYRWPVIGYPDDLRATTLDDVRSFFSTYYGPNNAVLTIAGDIDASDAITRVEANFGSIPSAETPAPPALRAPPLTARKHRTTPDRVSLTRLYYGFHLPPFGDSEWYAADLLALALSGGKSSPLYHDLVHQRQLAQDVSSFVYPTEASAVLILVATVRPGIETDVLSTAIDEYLDRPAISNDDLERARNQVITGFYSQLQSLDRRADLLSQHTTFFDAPEKIHDEVDAYLKLDRSALADVSQKYLGSDLGALVQVVPS